MSLPDDFTFSQSSLQDYVDCPRRFELRYIDGVRYPALEAQPALEHEEHMRKGEQFHKMAQQLFAGVPAELIAQSVEGDIELRQWWQKFVWEVENVLPTPIGVETTLQTALGEYRLIAKFDALARNEDGHFFIYDWKTSKNQMRRSLLQERMQTVVYRYVLSQAGAHLNGGVPIPPENISMVYWFVAKDGYSVSYRYSTDQMQTDETYLLKLIHDIESANLFPLTSETRYCRFCTYRSLCNRGESAGVWKNNDLDADIDEVIIDDGDDFNVDFDQIAEIEF